MKKYFFPLSFSLILTLTGLFNKQAHSQSLFFGNQRTGVEVGLNIGPSFFLGDLGGNRGEGTRFIKDVNLGLTKLTKGAFVTVYPRDWIGLRLAAQFGKLEGNDDKIYGNGGAELYRKQRNLDFRTNLFEAYFATEIYPFGFFKDIFGDEPRLSPYGVLGVGMYKYNPQGSLTNSNGVTTWYDLKPLRIEGQGMAEYPDRKEYKLTQINIPMGVGVKFWITENLNIGSEILWRKSFNDYVDDVSTTYIDPNLYNVYLSPADAQIARAISDKMYGIVDPNLTRFAPGEQRGNPNQNDSWFNVFLKFGWRITPSPYKSQMSKMRCPIRF